MLILKAIVWMFAALAGIAAICGYCIWMEKKAPTEAYDERQRIEHGKAAQISLAVGMIYFVVVMCWMHLDKMPADGSFLVFTGLMLELMVYHIYCLMTHAALPLSRKPWITIGNYALLGAVWVGHACLYDPEWGLGLVGPGSRFWLNIMTAFCCFALAVMHLISILWKEKE